MDVMQELETAQAVYTGKHFVYKEKGHGPNYINMDPLFPNLELTMKIGKKLAWPFLPLDFPVSGVVPQTVAAPATGGIVLAFATAWAIHQETGDEVAVVWADKAGDDFVFERAGFAQHLKNKRVLVVEDLLNSGGSVLKTCRAAEAHGAKIVGVSVVCNRGKSTAKSLGVPQLETLADVDFEVFAANDCPLCAQRVPIVIDIGHGADFIAVHPEYPGGWTSLLS